MIPMLNIYKLAQNSSVIVWKSPVSSQPPFIQEVDVLRGNEEVRARLSEVQCQFGTSDGIIRFVRRYENRGNRLQTQICSDG